MPVIVSDHALLRWLEREHGIDIESMREALAEKVAPAAEMKAKHVQLGSLWYILDGYKLVTVRPSRPNAASLTRHEGNHRTAPVERDKSPWHPRKRKSHSKPLR